MAPSDEGDCDRRIGEPHDEECLAYGEDDGVYEDGLQANDMFIVEGRQEQLWQQEGVRVRLSPDRPK